MKIFAKAFLICLALFVLTSTAFGSQKCLDAADEPHHRLIFGNKDVRIFELQLARLESTSVYCYAGPFINIIPRESRTTRTNSGHGGITTDWGAGDSRFVLTPVERTVRNETNVTHREIVIESHRKVEYNLLRNNLDNDEFPAVVDSHQPTWTVYFTRGSLSAQKTQLAAGDHISVATPDHLLIALEDLNLSLEGSKKAKEIRLNKTESAVLEGGTAITFTNQAKAPAKFILVEF
jgi:hypothetical protein